MLGTDYFYRNHGSHVNVVSINERWEKGKEIVIVSTSCYSPIKFTRVRTNRLPNVYLLKVTAVSYLESLYLSDLWKGSDWNVFLVLVTTLDIEVSQHLIILWFQQIYKHNSSVLMVFFNDIITILKIKHLTPKILFFQRTEWLDVSEIRHTGRTSVNHKTHKKLSSSLCLFPHLRSESCCVHSWPWTCDPPCLHLLNTEITCIQCPALLSK